MGKFAFVVVKLVPEAEEKTSEELEAEIQRELETRAIPYAKEIAKVTVIE